MPQWKMGRLGLAGAAGGFLFSLLVHLVTYSGLAIVPDSTILFVVNLAFALPAAWVGFHAVLGSSRLRLPGGDDADVPLWLRAMKLLLYGMFAYVLLTIFVFPDPAGGPAGQQLGNMRREYAFWMVVYWYLALQILEQGPGWWQRPTPGGTR